MAAPTDASLMVLAEKVSANLLGRGARLAAAESCTGGWVAKACTDLPGSSRWFAGGVVAYANEAKSALLGVDPVLIDTHGAVSEPVVRAMGRGALERFDADYSVAVSGVAGPGGGSVDKPVGTVWFAWARRDGAGEVVITTRREVFDGDRDSVRRHAVGRALGQLVAG